MISDRVVAMVCNISLCLTSYRIRCLDVERDCGMCYLFLLEYPRTLWITSSASNFASKNVNVVGGRYLSILKYF